MATAKPRKSRAPKREAKAAAEVLGTAELLEMILLELATDLQSNEKARKRLQPAYTLAKLRRVNEFFKNGIDRSSQLQSALQLSTYGNHDVLAPLDSLFKKQLGVTISSTNKQNRFHNGRFRLREIDINHHSKDWKPFVQFEKTKDKQNAMWRKVRIARPQDNLQEVTIDVTFRAGRAPLHLEKFIKTFRFGTDDNLGTVFEAFRKKTIEAHEMYWKLLGDLNSLSKRKMVETTYLD
ncbi:hypothetical protein HII31_02838 [Pseudocercospora fuligena]|uniref:Uncharacterized protein n=1 Tax=Pseudocercospora fuligena TaxID=685502 RepID=A0A8H6RRI0_9PEZI|nr:hypothetical protein HII31_02838 [Pseudocercospora fuligena]